jgi:hypothetical protein
MKYFCMALLLSIACASDSQAQDPTPQAQAPTPGVLVQPPLAAAVRQPPPPSGPLRNVRFEILVTDGGIPKPITKKVSLIVATGREGQVRSTAAEPQGNNAFTRAVPLNVDIIRPTILDNGAVSVAIVIEYQPMSPGTVAVPAMVKARIDVLLPNGRKTLISETADPTSDRTTTLEVTATVLP